jgi:hypothetical protein
MICCGSGSDFVKVLVPVPNPVFQKQKFVKNLVFSLSESALFPRKMVSFFIYLKLFYSILDPDPYPKPYPEQNPDSDAEPVPVSQRQKVPVLCYCFRYLYICHLRLVRWYNEKESLVLVPCGSSYESAIPPVDN